MTTTRGTTNRNQRGGSDARRRRREWLVETFRANVDVMPDEADPSEILTDLKRYRGHHEGFQIWSTPLDYGKPACRCYRCGVLLTVDTVTVDRIIPGCKGGTYKRNNIRPACLPCNSATGGSLRSTS